MEDKRSSLLKIVCSIGLAFNEYFTISRLCDEYQNLLGTPLAAAVREAGFMSVDEMLSSSSAIVTAYIHAKKHYKVDASAGTKASQEISALIKHQKSKKKKRIKLNTPDREYLSRNVSAARSFRVKSNYGAGFVQPFRDTTFQERQQLVRPTHGPPEGFKLPNYGNKGSFPSTVTGNPSDWKSSTDGNDKHTATIGSYSFLKNRISTSACSKYTSLPSGPTAFMKKEKTNEEFHNKDDLVRSPAAGVKRLLQALRACGGTATSEQLRNAYRKLHNADWDVDECVKYFGISSTRGVIDNYLKDVVEITSVKGTGRRCYVLVETQHEVGCATQRNRNSEETISKAKLCEALVSILVDKHPAILHTDRLTKVFLDEYGVSVEPESSLQLSWTRFITKFCSEEVVVDSRGNVSLNMKNPIVKDKVMKKSINDALEAPIDSDSDSSDDSFGSTPIVNNVKNWQTSQRAVPRKEATVYVDQSSATCSSRETKVPFNRFSKLSQSFHGSSKVKARFENDSEGCSVSAGTDMTNIKPHNVCVTVTSGNSRRYAFLSGRPSNVSASTSSSNSTSSSDTVRGTPVVEQPAWITKSLSSALAQRLTIDRRLTSKAFSAVGNFCKFGKSNKGAFEQTRLPRDASSVDNGDPKKQGTPGYRSKRSQEDVECAHPYFNVRCISRNGDARLWAARKGLSVKNDSVSDEDLI
uniref:Tudor domain-containing protein 7 n=1 Tax=Haemonchus contortus TaxID=6289 RepID=A0A7I4YFL2_HAECO